MNHLMPILYVVAGILIYEKAIKPMLEKKDEGGALPLESVDFD
jgi:hypothetical protein